MWEDTSKDVPRTYDDEPAGHVNRQWPELPSERHRQVLIVLDGQARVDRAGRRVVFGRQDRLAARLGISRRRLQELVADLRTPECDPRHPRTPPAGLRLGLLRVEPSRRPVAGSERTRYGVNVYVLLFERGAASAMRCQSAPAQKPVSAGHVKAHPDPSALHNKEDQVQPVSEGGLLEAPRARDPLDVGQQRPLERLDYDPGKAEILATLEAGLGPVEVLTEWPNDQPPGHPTYTTARGRVLELADGPLEDVHAAVDQLDRDTCMDGGCQPRHPCRRHTRRKRT